MDNIYNQKKVISSGFEISILLLRIFIMKWIDLISTYRIKHLFYRGFRKLICWLAQSWHLLRFTKSKEVCIKNSRRRETRANKSTINWRSMMTQLKIEKYLFLILINYNTSIYSSTKILLIFILLKFNRIIIGVYDFIYLIQDINILMELKVF